MSKHPFIFFNHGSPLDVHSFQGERYFIVWFTDNMKSKEQKQIEKLCPKPLKGLFSWGRSQFCSYTLLEEDYIWSYYHQKANMQSLDLQNKKAFKILDKQVFQMFADDIEYWMKEIHKISPITFVVSIERIVGSDWDKWSHLQGVAVFEQIEKFIKNTLNISHTEIFVVTKTLEMIQEIPSQTLDKNWIPAIQKLLEKF